MQALNFNWIVVFCFFFLNMKDPIWSKPGQIYLLEMQKSPGKVKYQKKLWLFYIFFEIAISELKVSFSFFKIEYLIST